LLPATTVLWLQDHPRRLQTSVINRLPDRLLFTLGQIIIVEQANKRRGGIRPCARPGLLLQICHLASQRFHIGGAPLPLLGGRATAVYG
jgi:hypothetical protein